MCKWIAGLPPPPANVFLLFSSSRAKIHAERDKGGKQRKQRKQTGLRTKNISNLSGHASDKVGNPCTVCPPNTKLFQQDEEVPTKSQIEHAKESTPPHIMQLTNMC